MLYNHIKITKLSLETQKQSESQDFNNTGREPII